jgi:hypothetical protein
MVSARQHIRWVCTDAGKIVIMKSVSTFGLSVLFVAALMAACSSGDSSPAPADSAGSSSGGGRGTTGGGGSNNGNPNGGSSAGSGVGGVGSSGSSGGTGSGGSTGAGGFGGIRLDAGEPPASAEGGVVSDAKGGDVSIAVEGGALLPDAGAELVSLFDGTTLNGWVELPASSWSVVNGAMHSLGTARGVIYTTQTYGDFRLIFTSRLVQDPANHNPCVLFWGNSLTTDALAAIQIQPPPGYMWDYRTTGPTANLSPDRFETRFAHPAISATQWSQCEMLANQAAGTLRFACCQVPTTGARCRAAEIVDFRDPTAGKRAPLALQVHNAGMIQEFKDLYVESPVAAPTTLITTQ